MNKKSPDSKSSKKGVVSFYIVIFATILFGVVTLSFTRIILSEERQSSDDDLSRSAYDSAMAGIEDAKRAINEYYRCLGGGSNIHGCGTTERNRLFREDCVDSASGDQYIGVAEYLGLGYNNNAETGGREILIQETSVGDDMNNSDQAYTCVTVTDIVPDYRGTLTADTPTRVVPLGVQSATSGSGLSGVSTLKFKWYSQLNMGRGASRSDLFKNLDNDGKLSNFTNSTIPPAVTASLIIAKNGATRDDDFYQANNTDKLTYSTVLLLPSDSAASETVAKKLNYDELITGTELTNAGNVKNDEHKKNHKPFTVECKTDQEFACSVQLDVSGFGLDENSTAMLVVSLPYGNTFSDFAVEMYRGADRIDFTGAQLSVDSTGRTNQLFRRVEVRLDPADLFFPYPQFELDLDSDADPEALKKYFWITANCWYSQPSTSGKIQTCDQNGDLP